MKHTKFVAGLGAAVLAAGSLALGLNVSPAQAAEGSTSGTLDYTCGLANGVANTITPYTDIDATISVTPATAPEGTEQVIKFDVGGNGVTKKGPSPFTNGPLVPVGKDAYQAVLNIKVNGGPLTNVVSPTGHPAKDPGEVVWANGFTASYAVTEDLGVNDVTIEQLVFNSASSGPAWVTGEPTDVAGDAQTFDSICNGGTNQGNIVGNTAPTPNYGPPTPQPDSYLEALETTFEVTPCEETTPTGTSTKVTASPASPKVVGTSVKFDAKVTPATCNADLGTLSGEVQFKNGSANLGAAQDVNASGEASVTTADLPVGTHQITAVFTSDDSEGGDGFANSTSAATSYTITAKTNPTPTPTPTPTKSTPTTAPTGPDTKPRSASATVTAYCDVSNVGFGALADYQFPIKTTVTPGAAAPGSTVEVSVAVNKSPINNGPTNIAAGQYRMEATIGFQGKSVQLIGPESKSAAVTGTGLLFKANELPLVAKGTIDLPEKEGEFPITVKDIWFNNQNNAPTGAADRLNDMFDQRCNASNAPQSAPKAFAAPVVSVESNADAPVPPIEPIDPPAGPGETAGPGGVLANTGPEEIIAIGVLALLVLQLGAVFAVRGYRASPRGARHL